MLKCADWDCDKSSVSDPDPHGSPIRWLPWIRIRIRDADSGSGSSIYKITKKMKNTEVFRNFSLNYFVGEFIKVKFCINSLIL